MKYVLGLLCLVASHCLSAQDTVTGGDDAPIVISGATYRSVKKIVVDASGHGDFTTIQAAINSLSDDAVMPRTIFIKKGIYKEKVFIEKNNLILEGEDKAGTILSYSLARDV